MAHIFILPSGQTMMLPDDILSKPEMDLLQALFYSADNFYEKISSPFIGRIHGELMQKKEAIQQLINQGQISKLDGWNEIAVVHYKAQLQIVEEEAQIHYLDMHHSELSMIKN